MYIYKAVYFLYILKNILDIRLFQAFSMIYLNNFVNLNIIKSLIIVLVIKGMNLNSKE